MASQLKKSTIKTNAKKQRASIFLQAEKTPLSIILRPKWKGSRSRRLEKENEPRCPQCGSLSSTAEAGTVIPYPEHLTDAVQRKEWPVLVGFLEVLLSFREILEATAVGEERSLTQISAFSWASLPFALAASS